jgi:hypothetical protein
MLVMQPCPVCHSSISLGATDCAVCGHLVAANSESRHPRSVDLLAVGIAAALWVAVTSTSLIWFYPVFVLTSLVAGLAIGWLASRRPPRALAMLVVPLGGSVLWLSYAADTDVSFGSAFLAVGCVQAALLTVPALVWPRRTS